MTNPQPPLVKAIQPTTGTVHLAVEMKHPYADHRVFSPACTTMSRSLRGTRHFLYPVNDERPVTCKRCAAR